MKTNTRQDLLWLADAQSATGIAFPPAECYHDVARPGLYEVHAFDALLFAGNVAQRHPLARQSWTVDELVREALVACGVVKAEAVR